MITNQLYSRFQPIINAAKQLPNSPPALFSKEEQKRIFPRMFPNQWVMNFANSGKFTPANTLQSIKCYMVMQESLDPYQEEDNHKDDQEGDQKEDQKEDKKEDDHEDSEKDSQPEENKDDNSFVDYSSESEVSNTSNNSNNNGNGNLNRSNSTTNQSTRIQRNDVCPLPGHLGHNWGQCYQNAPNTSMRPTRTHSPQHDAHMNKCSREPV
jgi:hypothetical protein